MVAAVLDLFAMTPVYFIATMVMLAVWDRVGGRGAGWIRRTLEL